MSPHSATRVGASRAAPVFSALGDETRLALMARLRAGRPQSIAQLALGLPVTRQAVTKHLQVLSHAGLVRDFRQGRERLWQPETKRLDEARLYLDAISRGWDAALARLKNLVEE
jgi:DNA-binding transcriptional ArsR family regulator